MNYLMWLLTVRDDPDDDDERYDALGAAKGLALAVVVMTVVWGLAILFAWLWLGSRWGET